MVKETLLMLLLRATSSQSDEVKQDRSERTEGEGEST